MSTCMWHEIMSPSLKTTADWLQFNHQLLETRLAKLDWVLSSRVEQMVLLIPRHWKFSLSRRNNQKTGWEALHNFTAPFLFPQGADETHIQHIFNETIHTRIVITTVRAPKLGLQFSGMGFSYTFSSCVLQAMKQPFPLESVPGLKVHTTVSFARLEDRKRKQGVTSASTKREKCKFLASLWWNGPKLWAVHPPGLSLHLKMPL